jgi:glycine/D-amino acid oxidase-like deaminating enzyme
MKNRLSRRNFIKTGAVTTGGVVATGIGLPFLMGEKEAIFDPNTSYWSTEQPPPAPPLKENINVDIAIVGGGYTGLSAALHLAQSDPDLEIVILEARQVGHGASGRNGGLVLSQTGPETMAIAYDNETHKWTYDLTTRSMKKIKSLADKSGINCELKLDGSCYTILNPEDLSYYEEYAAAARKMGIPLELWDRKRTVQALGTMRYCGCVFDPNSGQVHPMKWVKALTQAVENAGVRICGRSPVTTVREGKIIHLTIGQSDATVSAEAVVLAANGYVSKLGYFKNQVIPFHSQCAVTPPLTDSQLDKMGWQSRLPYYDSRNFLYHLQLTADQRIVIGGGSADYLFRDNLHYSKDLNRIADRMCDELVRLYPSLSGIRFETVWNGILGVTYDEFEVAGIMGEYGNIYYGLGYNGHGINLSFLFGEVICALYHGEYHGWKDTTYYDYPLKRLPPEPYKWLGIQGAMAYYRRRDKK